MSRPALRVPSDKLILWSVCALYQRSEQATDLPMKGDFGIKVALAVLHTLGCDRAAEGKAQTATFLFIDVAVPEGQQATT